MVALWIQKYIKFRLWTVLNRVSRSLNLICTDDVTAQLNLIIDSVAKVLVTEVLDWSLNG